MSFDFTKVFGVIEKGFGAIHTLVEQGQSAAPAITAIKDLVDSAKGGKVTDAQITATEATLDALIEDFNEPMG